MYQQHNVQVRCILIDSVSALTGNLAAVRFVPAGNLVRPFLRAFVPSEIPQDANQRRSPPANFSADPKAGPKAILA